MKLYTTREVSEMLGYKAKTKFHAVLRLFKTGQIHAWKRVERGGWVCTQEDVNNYLRNRRNGKSGNPFKKRILASAGFHLYLYPQGSRGLIKRGAICLN
jgi:hypothetical protein